MKTEGFKEKIKDIRRRAEGPRGRNLVAALLLFAALFVLYAAAPVSEIARRPSSLVVTDRKGRVLRGTLSSDGEWRLPVPLEEMGDRVPKVIVALEDRRFWSHCGVDPAAIVRALVQNVRSGRTVSGGSTITSQVVRLAEVRDRTVINKLKEFRDAMTVELFMTKREILEAYLNSAPFGGNIRGVEAASLTWFGKQAKDMSLAEAALLAGILRGPAVYRPDRHPKRAKELRDRLLDTLAERGVAAPDEAERAKNEPLPDRRLPLPARFVQAASAAARNVGPTEAETDRFGRLRSTLDADIQNLLLAELSRAAGSAGAGVTAAAVLVENGSGSVRGYIGNVWEGTERDAAWVDCASSYRSPGSVLKPFVYALDFESGALMPSSMLADAPIDEGPRNYDRMFRGPVSARTALVESLNVPAVRVLRQVGGRNALDLFARLGFRGFKHDAAWYGDSLILGGCEVTVLETARAFRTLAAGGLDAPLNWREGAKAEAGRRVLSEEACALTLDVLKDAGRLLPVYRDIFGEKGAVMALKTGTSYGRRDAWTAAVTPEYTLVLWFGDPSGKPNFALVGGGIAVPAAVRIMKGVMPAEPKRFKLPRGVKKGTFCALSGALRNPHCPQGMDDIYIENVSELEPCGLHVFRDGRVGIEWPNELRGFFADREAGTPSDELSMTSPRHGAVYTVKEGRELSFEAGGGKGELFWFVDGEFLGSTGPERRMPVKWRAETGVHRISVADESGGKSEAEITVRDIASNDGDGLPLLEESEH